MKTLPAWLTAALALGLAWPTNVTAQVTAGDLLPSGAIAVGSRARLAWSQDAPAAPFLKAYTFVLFIDGVQNLLSEVRCSDVRGFDGYECSGRLPSMAPGPHTIEVATEWEGRQSARSRPLAVMMLASAADDDVRTAAQAESTPSLERDRSVLAERLGRVSSLTALPDGRLAFVENGSVVRILDANLQLHTAFEVDALEGVIVGLTADPNFARSRFIYLAHTEVSHGQTRLDISRVREVGNVLGERATIVRGLPFTPGHAAPLAVDSQGTVYVALPAANDASAGLDALYAGHVLRFTASGGVPIGNRHASPIMAVGFARPLALAVDSARGQVWLAGDHPAWDYWVGVLSVSESDEAPWPQYPRAALPRSGAETGVEPSALVLTASTLTIASKDGVHRARLAPDGSMGALEALQVDSIGSISSVAAADGRLYVAMRSATGDSIRVLGNR